MKKLVLGTFLSRSESLPLEFLNSFHVNVTNDVKLILFTNSKFEHPLIDEGRLELVIVEGVNKGYYKWFKSLRTKNRHSRLYRFLFIGIQKISKWCIAKGVEIPSFCMNVLLSHYPVNFTRFLMWYNYLLRNESHDFFFTDVTDVVFQSSPFVSKFSNTVCAFEERDDISIGAETYNRSWILGLYHDEPDVQQLMLEPICCCGTILSSSYTNTTAFLKSMSLGILTDKMIGSVSGDMNTVKEFAITNGYRPAEQGVFNWLVFNNPEEFRRIKNGNIVYTVGTERADDIEVVDNQIKKVGTTDFPAVVHQYNRHPELNELVERCYGVQL